MEIQTATAQRSSGGLERMLKGANLISFGAVWRQAFHHRSDSADELYMFRIKVNVYYELAHL